MLIHELTHVRPYRDFVVEVAFACAYGVGFLESRLEYNDIPFAAEAFAI